MDGSDNSLDGLERALAYHKRGDLVYVGYIPPAVRVPSGLYETFTAGNTHHLSLSLSLALALSVLLQCTNIIYMYDLCF